MNRFQLAAVALMLCASGWAHANTPVFTIDDVRGTAPLVAMDVSRAVPLFRIRDLKNIMPRIEIDLSALDAPNSEPKPRETAAAVIFGAYRHANADRSRFAANGPFEPFNSANPFASRIADHVPDTEFDFGRENLSPVTPVPEPETWAMLLMGLCFIAYQARRRRNALFT